MDSVSVEDWNTSNKRGEGEGSVHLKFGQGREEMPRRTLSDGRKGVHVLCLLLKQDVHGRNDLGLGKLPAVELERIQKLRSPVSKSRFDAGREETHLVDGDDTGQDEEGRPELVERDVARDGLEEDERGRLD